MEPASSAAARIALALLIWVLSGLAWAVGESGIGTVESIAGTASALGAGGTMRVLAKDSQLFPGDIVQTEKDSAINLRFSDESKIALRAATRFKIDAYRFDRAKPAEDSAIFRLLKGGLRSVTGLIGKRGNPDAVRTVTATATIGIRGTDWAALSCVEGDPACEKLDVPEEMRTTKGQPAAGLYFTVFEGTIYVASNTATLDFSAGTSGYARDLDTAPVKLEKDPGLGRALMGFLGIAALQSPLDASPAVCLVKSR